jgi:hypothetical protein
MSNYHYTKGCHLPSIVKDGVIKQSTCLIEYKEKPAVWLTKSSEWEIACNIGKVINHQDFVSGQICDLNDIESVTVSNNYMKKEIGMCRILINESLPTISWAKFKYASGISESIFNAIDSHSRSIGCPVGEWICTFNPIPKEYWDAIEMFVNDEWVRWDEKIPIENFLDICLSCNGNENSKEIVAMWVNNMQVQKIIGFINKYENEIIDFWEANKGERGYVKVFVKSDYTPCVGGIMFIEQRVRKSTFHILEESETGRYALVQFLWEDTFGQHKLALAY